MKSIRIYRGKTVHIPSHNGGKNIFMYFDMFYKIFAQITVYVVIYDVYWCMPKCHLKIEVQRNLRLNCITSHLQNDFVYFIVFERKTNNF